MKLITQLLKTTVKATVFGYRLANTKSRNALIKKELKRLEKNGVEMSKQAKVLNNAEIKRLKAVINDNRYAVRNMTMLLLGLNVGLRAKEIVSLKISDVLTDDLQVREMCVLAKEQTKRNEANRIFFNNTVRKQIEKYLNDDAYKHLKHKRQHFVYY